MKKIGEELVAFEHLNAPQVQPILEDISTQTIKKHDWEKKTFKDYFADAGEKRQNLFYSIRDYILSLGDDITENQLKYYVAFKKAKNVICVEVYQFAILLHLKLNPNTVDLVSEFIEDVSKKGHWGIGDLRIIIKNKEDFEKAQFLIDRAYNEN